MAYRSHIMKLLILGASAFAIGGCPFPPSPPTPPPANGKFSQFGVSPNPICTNLGVPILRLSWAVTGSGQTCLSNLRINGTGVSGNIWDVGIQNTRCGDGNYSRELAFSLSSVFGNNIPSSVTV